MALVPSLDAVASSLVPRRAQPAAHFRAFIRLWRRKWARRRMLAQILAETRDPRLIEEAGISRPPPRLLEQWMVALLNHRR